MSSENPPNGAAGGGTSHRRSSITQAALSNLFQRGPSNGANGSSFSGPAGAPLNDPQRRRLSVTTIGLSGTSPTNPAAFGMRRESMSTNSDSIDESAVEDEDMPPGSARTAPATPFVRRMSFGASAMRGYRPGGSPGNGNTPASPPSSLGAGRRPSGHRPSQAPQGSAVTAALSAAGRRASTALPSATLPQASNTKHPRASSDNVPPRADQHGFNWSEQLRSRAESSVSSARPSFPLASSPPRGQPHDRAKSVSDMPQPPAQAAAVKPKSESRKPDAFQERILKGDFYMD